MPTPALVEALLAGLVGNDEVCEAYPDMGALRLRAEGDGRSVPLQWALCVADLPLAHGLIRHAAQALLGLLDALDAANDEGAADGCPLWRALQLAPGWLLRPAAPDDDEPDIALLLERDETYHGDWQALIEALHRAGSRPWQGAIQRCRAMQQYERAHGLNLGALLQPDDPPPNPGPLVCAEEEPPCSTLPPTA